MVGRSLLTLANVITVAAPLAADWNDSHIFNERWPAHARFHGVTALAMATSLSAANIWSIWSGAGDRARARFFAGGCRPLLPHRSSPDAPGPACGGRRRRWHDVHKVLADRCGPAGGVAGGACARPDRWS